LLYQLSTSWGLPGGVRFIVSEVNADPDNASVNFQFRMMVRERDLVICLLTTALR
jgi:hypothetical protein